MGHEGENYHGHTLITKRHSYQAEDMSMLEILHDHALLQKWLYHFTVQCGSYNITQSSKN